MIDANRGWRKRKARTFLGVAGMALCATALVMVDGMLGFMQAERMRELERLENVLILHTRHAGYPPYKSFLRDDLAPSALGRAGVLAGESTPILLAALEPPVNPMKEAYIIGVGLWPGRERAWFGPYEADAGRATLVGAGGDAVILGWQAARFYGARAPGARVRFAGSRWRVVGILKQTGLQNLDNAAIIPLATAQAALRLDGWISAVMIRTRKGAERALAKALSAAFPDLEVSTRATVDRLLHMELAMPRRFLGTISWIALLVAILIDAYLVSLAVHEQVDEVETIRAIGANRPAILASTFSATLVLSLIGGGLGTLASVPLAHAFDWMWIFTGPEMARLAGLILGTGLLAGVYPAYRAVRDYPRALRYDELQCLMEEVGAEKRALDRAYRQLMRGREEERGRIARELHDQTIQSLVALKFRLAESAPAAAEELSAEISGIIDSLRGLCSDLRPPALERLGLTAALRSHADGFAVRTGMPVGLTIEGVERRLPPEIELALFRVVQEAIVNVWKHAQAPGAEVILSYGEDSLVLKIADRGRGFQVPERLGLLAEQEHFGLVSMRERLDQIGGTLSVHSEPGIGTTVTAQISLISPREAG